MLFSRDDVASYINQAFEPAWESVRPVPTVRIDFGNDNVLTRTLNGNIATYVCAADGQLLDVLPGIYEPKQYQKSLEQLRLLARYVDQGDKPDRQAKLQDYHRRQFKALAANEAPHVIASNAGISKRKVERPTLVLMTAERAGAFGVSPEINTTDAATAEHRGDVSTWKSLAADTKLNEMVRRRQIHEHLAGLTAVRPERVVKHVYKDVLHTDLDDPYLGLGKTLFAEYPFAKEDMGH